MSVSMLYRPWNVYERLFLYGLFGFAAEVKSIRNDGADEADEEPRGGAAAYADLITCYHFDGSSKISMFFSTTLPLFLPLSFLSVCFTATWEAVEHGNRKLIGVTSMYIFFVYGLSILLLEKLYLNLKDIIPLPLRAAIYVLVCYCWEFSTGLFLKRWDACPWDYESYFHYHFMGLITFEYIPVWYISSIACERFLIRYALQSAWLVTEEKRQA